MSYTVVVVDDDPVVRAILQAVLGSGGYQVQMAAGADEAMPVIRRSQPAVIFVDRFMPGRDGVQLCRDIRADRELATQPFVVLLTADADRVEPELAASAGINMVLAKPVGPAQLLGLLAEITPGQGGSAGF
jgi:CheY-like chemotaxis protein